MSNGQWVMIERKDSGQGLGVRLISKVWEREGGIRGKKERMRGTEDGEEPLQEQAYVQY